MDREITEQAIGAYGRALNVVDPLRLRFWDGRGLMNAAAPSDVPPTGVGRSGGWRAGPNDAPAPSDDHRAHRPARPAQADRTPARHPRPTNRALHADRRRPTVIRVVEEARRAHLERVFEELDEEHVRPLIESRPEVSRAAEDVHDRGEFRL